jgi:Asp-tRNA(Asn)/Glu-tRNA(Gln) amidotransferase A subunit family amidase
VGIKPTVGLVSRDGIVPISHSQDTAGPMTRTVADAAVLLSAMAGADPRDAATAMPRRRTTRGSSTRSAWPARASASCARCSGRTTR